ncbi:unnamed protein product [Brassicogethes aeneus]|uniref:Uncharacterized protein n=1 Tax=Brassicogethes aeneus TaxID=1431903 RepID=A0A9P0BAM9_BRAAE|nr:unnamed protein product [Brassicogethes aeneus]
MSESKPDTVPGLGFKDKEKAEETIKNLEGRDPDYQKLAIKGLIGRAKRTLTLTKDKDKLQNINDAMAIFEKWLKDFEYDNRSKENRAYLPLATVKILLPLKEQFGIEDKKASSFLSAYEKKAKGEYKHLRTVASEEDKPTWDIVRNSELRSLLKKLDEDRPDLWKDDLPTKEHMQLILWAYSPDAAKIKKNLSNLEEKLGGKSSQSSSEEDESDDDKGKRKSSGDSDEESPKKKSKK